MEKTKRKMKLGEKIILLVLFVALISSLNFMRKYNILKNIDKAYEKNSQISNYHIKSSQHGGLDEGMTTMATDTYYKDDESIIIHKWYDSENKQQKQMINTNLKNDKSTYILVDGNYVQNDSNAMLDTFPNSTVENIFGEPPTTWQYYKIVFYSKISSDRAKGKDCYKIRYGNSLLEMFSNSGMAAYIEKETGLLIRKCMELSKDAESVIDYYYDFNTVTDENLLVPDIDKYADLQEPEDTEEPEVVDTEIDVVIENSEKVENVLPQDVVTNNKEPVTDSGDKVTEVISNINDVEEVDGVTLVVDESTLSPKGANITITDKNEEPYRYSAAYQIQVKQNNKWKDLELKTDDLSWITRMYDVNENGVLTMYLDWTEYFGTLERGIYRIVKSTGSKPIFSNQFTIE